MKYWLEIIVFPIDVLIFWLLYIYNYGFSAVNIGIS